MIAPGDLFFCNTSSVMDRAHEVFREGQARRDQSVSCYPFGAPLLIGNNVDGAKDLGRKQRPA